VAKCVICGNKPKDSKTTTCKVGYVYSKSIENIEFDCDEFVVNEIGDYVTANGMVGNLRCTRPLVKDNPKVAELSINKKVRKSMSHKVDKVKVKRVRTAKKMSHKRDNYSNRILNSRLPLTEIAKIFKVSRKTIERWIPEKLKSDKLRDVIKLDNELKNE